MRILLTESWPCRRSAQLRPAAWRFGSPAGAMGQRRALRFARGCRKSGETIDVQLEMVTIPRSQSREAGPAWWAWPAACRFRGPVRRQSASDRLSIRPIRPVWLYRPHQKPHHELVPSRSGGRLLRRRGRRMRQQWSARGIHGTRSRCCSWRVCPFGYRHAPIPGKHPNASPGPAPSRPTGRAPTSSTTGIKTGSSYETYRPENRSARSRADNLAPYPDLDPCAGPAVGTGLVEASRVRCAGRWRQRSRSSPSAGSAQRRHRQEPDPAGSSGGPAETSTSNLGHGERPCRCSLAPRARAQTDRNDRNLASGR